MKTNVLGRLALFAMFAINCFALPLPGKAQGYVNVYPGLVPVDIYADPQGAAQVLNAIMTGTGNAYFQPMSAGCTINATNITSQGDIRGTALLYAVAILSTSETFTLADVNYSLNSSDGSISGSGTFLNAGGFSGFAMGVYHDPDGNMTVYTNDEVNAPINALYALGASFSFDTTGLSPASVENEQFGLTATYDVAGLNLNGSGTVNFSPDAQIAPEPGTLALIGIGGLSLLRLYRRRK